MARGDQRKKLEGAIQILKETQRELLRNFERDNRELQQTIDNLERAIELDEKTE